MSNPIEVPSEFLQKVASFVEATAPDLEELQSTREGLAKVATQAVDGMVEQGLIRQDSREAALKELEDGGVEKLAEALQFILQNASPATPSMGGPDTKSAAAAGGGDDEKESDRVFRMGFLGS